jgi:hypothetical protein
MPSRPFATRNALVPAAVLALVAACGGSTVSTPSPAASQPAPATAAPTQAATQAIATAIVNAPLCFVAKQDECGIAIGSYTTAPFEHPFTFAIAERMINVRASEHGGGLETTSRAGSFSWVSSIEKGFPGEVAIGPKAADFLAFITSASKLPGFTVGEPVAVTVGGMPATRIDLARTNEAEPFGFSIAEDVYFVDAGATDRFWVLEVGGALVVLIAEANLSGNFDGHAARVQPIVDSVAWQ